MVAGTLSLEDDVNDYDALRDYLKKQHLPEFVLTFDEIEAIIHNALRAQELALREGSLAAFIWRSEPEAKALATPQTASTSAASHALSKDLKKLGWKFVGPTTMYAFMQAMGLINDHVEDCVIRAKVERARKSFTRPWRRLD